METEERILSLTLELFKTNGIRRITMDQIASELGMSKRTIYQVFKDRDNLVYRTLEYGMRMERNDLMQIISEASNVIEALYLIGKDGQMKRSRINPLFFEDIRKYAIRYFKNSSGNKRIQNDDITYMLLERGMKEGIFLPGLDADVINVFIHEMMNLAHNTEILPDSMDREKLIIQNIFLPYFRGISTPRGRELLEAYFSHHHPDEAHG